MKSADGISDAIVKCGKGGRVSCDDGKLLEFVHIMLLLHKLIHHDMSDRNEGNRVL